jgi:hypothetical protein
MFGKTVTGIISIEEGENRQGQQGSHYGAEIH